MPPRGNLAGDQSRRISLAGGGSLDLSRPPLIMGILNATPDSFYEASRLNDVEEAVGRALEMVAEGVEMLDVGGESTRPGSLPVSAATELARVVPLIEAIRSKTEVPISIDTRKAVVARSAVAAGADIINDVSALRDDPQMAATAAELRVPVILMHMRGTPLDMQVDPHYDDAVREVCEELRRRAEAAIAAGVSAKAIILDPGIGFGKRVEDNLALIRGIPQLKRIGYPVLIGLSRKGFLGRVTKDRRVEGRLAATVAANAYAALAGADILRVHDVAEAVDMKRVLRAIAAGN